MTDKETQKVLDELQNVRPEVLNDEAKRLFEAIMKIADSRDKAEADLYEANNRINDLLDTIKLKEDQIEYIENEYGRTIEQKDELINLMSEDIYDSQIECYRYFKDIEDVKNTLKRGVTNEQIYYI